MVQVQEKKGHLVSVLSEGGTLDTENATATTANTARIVGHIQGLDQLLAIYFEDSEETEEQ